MNIVPIAAYVYGFSTALIVVFQFGLAAGAPWGEAAMCGKFPGRLPPMMRILAVAAVVFWGFLAVIVFSRSGIVFEQWFTISRNLQWIVVVITFISALRNLFTPNKKQRSMWAPVGIVLFICSLIVTLG